MKKQLTSSILFIVGAVLVFGCRKADNPTPSVIASPEVKAIQVVDLAKPNDTLTFKLIYNPKGQIVQIRDSFNLIGLRKVTNIGYLGGLITSMQQLFYTNPNSINHFRQVVCNYNADDLLTRRVEREGVTFAINKSITYTTIPVSSNRFKLAYYDSISGRSDSIIKDINSPNYYLQYSGYQVQNGVKKLLKLIWYRFDPGLGRYTVYSGALNIPANDYPDTSLLYTYNRVDIKCPLGLKNYYKAIKRAEESVLVLDFSQMLLIDENGDLYDSQSNGRMGNQAFKVLNILKHSNGYVASYQINSTNGSSPTRSLQVFYRY